jgi:hypothetical protein
MFKVGTLSRPLARCCRRQIGSHGASLRGGVNARSEAPDASTDKRGMTHRERVARSLDDLHVGAFDARPEALRDAS